MARLGEVVNWHVIIDGEQLGPLSRDQVLEYLHGGQLIGSDLIWRPGFSDWKPVNELADFRQPPKRGLPPPLPAPTEPFGQNDDHGDVAAIPLTAPQKKKWSIWKAANRGLIFSILLLAIQIASGRGFELADLAYTASISTFSQLAGQILVGPLLFVIIAVVRNIIRWRLPKSDARATEGAIVFSLIFAAIGVSLALYGQWFFSSTERISGATRDHFAKTMQSACIQRQVSLGQAERLSSDQISKYCTCVSNQIADGTTYEGMMRDTAASDTQQYLKQQAEAAGQTCRNRMGQ